MLIKRLNILTKQLIKFWNKSKGDDEMNFNDDFNEVEKQVKKTFKWSAITVLIGSGLSLAFIGAVIWILVKTIA